MRTNKEVLAALFIAFGLLIPMFFHAVGAGGVIFLPMHIPVLLSGFILAAKWGALVGCLTPLLSSLLTGMPAIMPQLPLMTLELTAYGAAAGFFYAEKKLPVLPALLLSMVVGRVVAMFGIIFLVDILGLNVIKLQPLSYAYFALVTGIPGVILQLIIIPFLVKGIGKIIGRS